MHCPHCGQKQVSDEIKFCSRCGFQLAVVSELLAYGGTLPQLAALHQGKAAYLTRRNGLIFTALWFIFFVMMLPAFFGIAEAEVMAAIAAIFGTFTSMMLMIISLAFLKRTPRPPSELPAYGGIIDPQAELPAPGTLHALPRAGQVEAESPYIPPDGLWRAPDTGELRRPGSVTEGTTKLLKKDERF